MLILTGIWTIIAVCCSLRGAASLSKAEHSNVASLLLPVSFSAWLGDGATLLTVP
jgi:hypothetical protein